MSSKTPKSTTNEKYYAENTTDEDTNDEMSQNNNLKSNNLENLEQNFEDSLQKSTNQNIDYRSNNHYKTGNFGKVPLTASPNKS